MQNRQTLISELLIVSITFLTLSGCGGSTTDVETPNLVVSPAPDPSPDNPDVIVQPVDLINDYPATKNQAKFTTFDGLGHQSHQYVLSLLGMGNALPTDDIFNQNLYSWMMEQNKSER